MAGEDGGSFSSAPPPVSGLGNYKGVMLCNRPTEDSGLSRLQGDSNPPPFRAMISATCRDQLGLPPPKPEEAPVEVKSRGSSAALRRHVRWIKDLQQQVQADHTHYDMEVKRMEDHKDSMQEVFKKQRDAIRQLRKENDGVVDRQDLEAVMEQFPPTGAKARKVKGQKPVWAMTEQEKEALEEEEAANLIKFAEDLDFDKFLGDHEFRAHLQAMQDRARKLQKEQDAFKDSIIKEFNQVDDAEGSELGSRFEDGLDGASLLGDVGNEAGAPSRRRRRRDGDGVGERPDWDASTAFGEDAGVGVDRGQKAMAEHVLENNPRIRSVHSKDSIQRLVEKARSEGMPRTPGSQVL